MSHSKMQEEVTARRNGFGRRRIATAFLAACLLGLAACGSGEQSADASPKAGTDAGGKASGSAEVLMRLIAYKPQTLKVRTGMAVTWRQQDAGFHTVTSGRVEKDASGSVKTNPDGTFDSGRLAKGREFSFTFSEAGTYEYFCEIHPATMNGRVDVE